MPSPTQKHCKLYIKDASGEIIQMLPRTTIPEYQGATGSASGTAGTVPPASSADKDNFLKGDGTWGEIEKADAAGEFETAQTVALTGDVTGSATSKAGWSIAATLASTGVSASTYGPSASASPSHGGKFSVPSFTVDAKGRITSAATREITLPASGNTDTKVNVTLETTTKAYLLGTSTTPTSTAAAVAAVADTGVYLDTAAGKLTAATFAGSLSGNASSATEFSAAKSVTLTGDVTGTASSKAGWSVATTLADSGVTAGTIGSDTQQTPSHGGTFSIPYVTVDSKGRVTAGGTTTVKLPADSNTDTKVNVTLGTTTKAYLLGTSTTPALTAAGVTAVADTGVYLDTTAGRLTAGSFAGNVENGTLAAANAVVVTDANKKLTASTSITATELGYLDGVTSSIQTQLNAKAEDSGVVHTTGAETVAGVKTFTSDLEVQKLHYLGERSFSIGTQGTGAATYLQINSLVDSKSITIANQGTNNITLTSKGNITAAGTITGNKIVGDGSGLTNLNGSSIATGTVAADRIANLDASKITSGTIDIARLPAGALERLVTVADQTARFALTASDVQLGDTVKQEDTGLMYYVVDTSKLSSADGYAEYTAGSATSVPWSGVTGKPSTFAPSAHNQASSTINAMTGYSKPSSTSAIGTSDTLNAAIGKLEKALDGKAASSHNQASSTINAMTGYSKPSSTSAISTSDTLNAAIGKLEKALDGKQASGSYAASTHSHTGTEVVLTGYAKASSAEAVAATDTANAAIGKLEKALDGKAASSHGTHVTFSTDAPKAAGTASAGGSSTVTVAKSDHVHPLQTTVSGNAGTATKFASAQTVALTGDVTGSASSQAGWSIATTLADSGVTAGTIGNDAQQTPAHGGTFNIPYVTVDSKGRVTAGGTTTVKLPADNNTDTKVNVTLGTTTKAYLLGTSTTPTSTAAGVTAISDTGVYLDTTAGRLTAGSFAGDGQNITYGAANAVVVTDANKKLVSHSSITTTELGYLDGVTSSIQTQLNGKAASSHSHASSEVTAMTSYSKPSSTSAIAATDSLNTAIGKLEKALDGKAASSHGTHVTYSTSNPLVAGTASAGSANNVSRGDHVHPEQMTVKQAKGIFLVIPAQTSQTATLTATVDGITEYFPGLTIAYRAPFNTAASSTLNINSLGAKPIYYKVNTASKDYYPANSVVLLVYETTTVSTGCWKMIYSYDGNTNYYDRRNHSGAVKAAAAVASGTVIVGTAAGYKTAASGVTFDISYPILYAGGAIAANATATNTYEAVNGVNLQTTKASWTGTQYSTVYLVGTLSGTTVTIDSSIFTTTVPSSADDKVYIPIGVLYSTYQVYFAPTRDIYQYTNGSFHPLDTTTAATGGTNGTIKINGTEVAVKGLGSAAYTASTAYAAASHNQASSTINAMTGYSKPSSTSAIAATDTLNAAIGKLEKALDGKQASGSYAAASHSHDASNINSGTLDAARIPNLDASKITSGTIDIARLPAGALERLVTVANQTARFALTSSNVQLGDTVRQSDTGLMYYVVDTSKLNSADGYAEYTAGAATSVPWSGVTGKPSTFTPSAHNQASNTINAMTGYSKPSSTSAIGTSDTLNAAIGKLEKALDGKQASGTYLTPSSTLDATKLSGTIPSGCYTNTVYTHPTTSGNKHVPSGGSSGQFLGWDSDGTAKWVANPNSNWTTHLYAGAASNATANATSATTNAATYIVVCDNSTARNAVQVTGTNGTTVSAVNGKLTIDSVSLSAVTNAEIDAAIFA